MRCWTGGAFDVDATGVATAGADDVEAIEMTLGVSAVGCATALYDSTILLIESAVRVDVEVCCPKSLVEVNDHVIN
jgi:hypothetical protein